jgi:hypothetical protein
MSTFGESDGMQTTNDAYLNYREGRHLDSLGRYDEALACFERAVSIAPGDPQTRLNRSMLLLKIGDFECGWKEFEWRFRIMMGRKLRFPIAWPLWMGQASLKDKTILLYAEFGLGDTIQFCRYVRLLAAQGARVVLEVQPELRSLMMKLEGVDHVLADDEPVPKVDFYCPIMSLPLAFQTRMDSIPAAPSYLVCDPTRRTAWAARLGTRTAPRIGLAWSGNPTHPNDGERSMPLAILADVIRSLSSNAQFVSLQKDVRASDRPVLDALAVIDFSGVIQDFADTAALIANLDLVITVDTSVAHLAGAMGKPVWILLPFNAEFRWLIDRSDSPWYPSARLFRQSSAGDWDGVISKVAERMAAFL